MTQEFNISVVIPVIGNLEHTKVCITSLIEMSKFVDEIILVENGPEKENAKWIVENINFPFKILFANEKRYVSQSWDDGIKIAKNNIVAVINNDIKVIEKYWDENLLMLWSKYDKAAIFCPWPIHEETQETDRNAPPLEGLNGSFFLIKKDMVEQTDNFKTKGMYVDHGFVRAYWEDVDLLTQVRKAGFEGYVTPAIRIVHYENKTAGPMLPSGKNMDNPYWINLDYFNRKYDVHIWDYFKVFMSNVLHETTNKRLI